ARAHHAYTASLLLLGCRSPRARPSFPTRRSSDLAQLGDSQIAARRASRPVRDRSTAYGAALGRAIVDWATGDRFSETRGLAWKPDRKSTRLNSSHGSSSYAVSALKKKSSAR